MACPLMVIPVCMVPFQLLLCSTRYKSLSRPEDTTGTFNSRFVLASILASESPFQLGSFHDVASPPFPFQWYPTADCAAWAQGFLLKATPDTQKSLSVLGLEMRASSPDRPTGMGTHWCTKLPFL